MQTPPSLFRLGADSAAQLLLARCSGCGELTFPVTAPGCRACGLPLDQCETVEYSGTAKLLDWVQLHATVVPGMRVPYLVAEVELLPGLIVTAALAERPAGSYRRGMEVRAWVVPSAANDEPRCVFAPGDGSVE